MKKFIKSSVMFVEKSGAKRYNNPVNMDNVNTYIIGNELEEFSENFSIEFIFFNGKSEIWLYTSVEKRNRDAAEIEIDNTFDLGDCR